MKVKYVLLLLIFLCTTILFPTGTGTAGDFIIFGNDLKPPKIYLENKEPKGILVDILNYIERDSDIKFTIKLVPWARAFDYAKNGHGGIVGLSKTQARVKLFDFSTVLFYDDIMIVVLKGYEFQFSAIQDLQGMIVGVRRGSSYGDTFEEGRKTVFTVSEDSNSKQRLKKLLRKRIDAALVGPGKRGVYLSIESDPELMTAKDQFVILKQPFKRDPNYLGFAKKMQKTDLLIKINTSVEKGYKNGEIPRLIDRYE